MESRIRAVMKSIVLSFTLLCTQGAQGVPLVVVSGFAPCFVELDLFGGNRQVLLYAGMIGIGRFPDSINFSKMLFDGGDLAHAAKNFLHGFKIAFRLVQLFEIIQRLRLPDPDPDFPAQFADLTDHGQLVFALKQFVERL